MALVTTKKRGKPYYIVRWGYYTDDTGRQRCQERGFTDRRAALDLDSAVSVGMEVASGTATIAHLCELWMQQHVDPNLQQRTRRGYRSIVNRLIVPHLGRKRAARLTPRDVSKWMNTLTATGQSPASANGALRALKAMLRWCRAEGYTQCRAADDVRRKKQPEPEEANPYTPEEIERIASSARLLRDATIIMLGAYSGLRWSELAALHWKDVDLDTGVIQLRQSLDLDRTFKAPKTTNGRREVPIIRPGLEALQEWRRHAPLTPLVFPGSNARPLGRSWHRWYLEPIREASGIHVQMNQLRDTYASLLIGAGIGEVELTLWLGHSSVEVTRRHYGRLLDQRKLTLVGKANDLVAGMLAAQA